MRRLYPSSNDLSLISYRTAEEKKVFVNAIKEATKLNAPPGSTTALNGPPGRPVVRGFADVNQNSTVNSILPSKPAIVPRKMKQFYDQQMNDDVNCKRREDNDTSSEISTSGHSNVSRRSRTPSPSRRKASGLKKLQNVFQ